MFALISRIEIVIRTLLTATVLFNALTPTAALAKSSVTTNDMVGSLEHKIEKKTSEIDPISLTTDNHQQRFARPTSRVSEPAKETENVLMQTGTVLLQCDPSSMTWPAFGSICASSTPNISLTESFVSSAGIEGSAWGEVRFKVVCQGGNCAPQDIYYLVNMTGEFLSTPAFGSCPGSGPCDWRISLYNDIHFMTTSFRGMQNVVCGTTPSGSCQFQIAGVIPKEMLSANSANWSNYYFRIHAGISNPASWEWVSVDADVQVSLDSGLLDLQVHQRL